MAPLIHMLHLEDDPADAELIRAKIEAVGLACRLSRVQTRDEFDHALKRGGYDIILADYWLPMYDGLSALRLTLESCPEIPFIFVSGTMGEEAAIEALTQGATDYVLKQNLSRLAPAVQRALLEVENRRGRRQAQKALQRANRINAARIHLMQFAASHCLDDLLEETVNQAEKLTDSRIGFYHLLDDDEQALTHQNWSTRTKARFCKARSKGLHYPIADSGIWADSVRQRKPVVHNDYASLTHGKGLPEGHAPLVRELVMPVVRGDKIKAILGVGNKAAEYSQKDVEAISLLADLAWEITERKQVEAALVAREHEFRTLAENLPDNIVRYDREGRTVYVNPVLENTLGAGAAKMIGTRVREFHTDGSYEAYAQAVDTALASGENGEIEFMVPGPGKEPIVHQIRMINERDEHGEVTGLLTIGRDITERKKLETQLLQAQKMESVGRLAGGVAHDFNNMLGVITGHAELALDQLEPDNPLFGSLKEIFKAAKRSAGLTRQLLAFARRQVVAPKVLDLNRTVEGMLKMLRRLIGEDIDLVWLPDADVWPVKMDPAQIDQILANLCVNARDAIADGGRITIETGMTTLEEAYCADHAGFVPGDFVVMTVSDDGLGMDKATIEMIFEPFFTTKERGKGTGLGMAMVYGIVKQNDGFINVYSEPNYGTTFRIYLPRHVVTDEPAPKRGPAAAIIRGQETILLVEDEPAILELTRLMLTRLGYQVFAAATPDEALAIAAAHPGEIQLLITDVIMPGMNGRELAKRLLSLSPATHYLFMSGYTEDVIAHHAVLDEGIHFIQKPFSLKVLATKVREVLDEKPENTD